MWELEVMKILYVTDLHGDKEKYKKTLEIAIEKQIDVIVNGGDMLPKQCNRHLEQPVFIKQFLREYFKELQNYIAGRIVYINGFEFLGMDYILAHPFGC